MSRLVSNVKITTRQEPMIILSSSSSLHTSSVQGLGVSILLQSGQVILSNNRVGLRVGHSRLNHFFNGCPDRHGGRCLSIILVAEDVESSIGAEVGCDSEGLTNELEKVGEEGEESSGDDGGLWVDEVVG